MFPDVKMCDCAWAKVLNFTTNHNLFNYLIAYIFLLSSIPIMHGFYLDKECIFHIAWVLKYKRQKLIVLPRVSKQP